MNSFGGVLLVVLVVCAFICIFVCILVGVGLFFEDLIRTTDTVLLLDMTVESVKALRLATSYLDMVVEDERVTVLGAELTDELRTRGRVVEQGIDGSHVLLFVYRHTDLV
jgi:hypothetical protein